jgi:hypothetical protein
MAFLLGGANSAKGYNISNSVRLNDNDSPELSFTLNENPTHQDKGTWSFWIKRGNILSAVSRIFSAYADSGATQTWIRFDAADKLDICNRVSSSNNTRLVTNRVFRDPSAWYHIVVAFDTSDGTEANRVKLYVNGTQETSLGTATYPSQNDDLEGNTNGIPHSWGCDGVNNDEYFDGYLSEVHFVDGAQKAATDFGEVNDDGVWIPKAYRSSHGTNGYRFQFLQTGTSANASGIGADTSGNDKHFTLTNLAAIDVAIDTPTNNFATLNPANKFGSCVVSKGNLEYDSNSSSGSSMVSTIAPANGKWYVEIKAVTSTIHIGVAEVGLDSFRSKGQGGSRPNINYQYGGGVEIDGSNVDSEATFTSDDIIGFALNLDDGELIIYKNGTALNSGTAYNLHTNTTHGNTGFSVQTATGSGNTKASFNFGSPAHAVSSGNADANGYGNFEYTVPTNYYALCTKNLAEYG